MKVLIVNPIIYTSETASIKRAPSIRDTMIYDLCLAFLKKGHEVNLLAGEPFRPEQEEEYPFKVFWAKCALPKICRPNVLPFCPEIKKIVSNEKYDLIISSEVFSLNSFMLARKCKGNLIIWHELAKHNNLLHKIPSKLWYGVIARLFMSRTPIIARSSEAKEFISKYCRNVSDKIIDHGVNLEKFEARTEKDKFFIVSSQLIERKRIDKIIEKFSVFSKAHPEYKLYIFGEGDKESELKTQSERLGLSDKILFFGKVNHDTLKEYLSRAAAMLVYTRKDNNMVSIVEAIACATPTVTTSVPYNASYIKASGLGIVNDEWNETDLEEIINNKSSIENCLKYRSEISTEKKADLFINEKRGKKILLSSYSVNPYHGSEDGTGWNWTLQLSRNFNGKGDRIYLVTKKVNESDTKKGIAENGLDNVELVIVDTPYWLNWYREHNSAFHHFYYILWQAVAYRWAKKSEIAFDVVHHATMGDFRIPGFMWKLKKPYTIFGPVGGGQSTPAALKDYEANKRVEKFREIINKSRAVLPTYKKAVKSFNRVFAINAETQELMSRAMGKSCDRLIELAPEDRLKGLEIRRNPNPERPVVLYMGRLIEKKGLMLFLDVINAMPKELNFEVKIYGGGPLEERAKSYIKEHSLEDMVTLCGTVEHGEVSGIYKSSDIFVMPSLRETGGNVIVEAMAHKLPVMALDMSISRDLKEYGCGEFVGVEQSRDGIISEFAKKLALLISQPQRRAECGENGYRFVNEELSWERKFKTVYSEII